MITLYGIKTCGSVKKAIIFLDKHNIPFNFIDLKTHSLKSSLIIEWIKKMGIKIVLNTKGTTYKNLKKANLIRDGLCEDSKSLLKEQVALLMQYPLLLKRPIITYRNEIIIGYEQEAISTLLHKYQQDKL